MNAHVDDGLSDFKVTILDEVMVAHDRDAWTRFAIFLRDTTIKSSFDMSRLATTWEGRAGQPQITALQAAARGDDLGMVLDMFGAPPIGEPDD